MSQRQIYKKKISMGVHGAILCHHQNFFFLNLKLNVLLCNTLRRGAAVAQQIEQVY